MTTSNSFHYEINCGAKKRKKKKKNLFFSIFDANTTTENNVHFKHNSRLLQRFTDNSSALKEQEINSTGVHNDYRGRCT